MAEQPSGETEAERVDRAMRLAEQRARKETIVDTRLDGHDRRLASINGQLERGAKAQELVAERMGRLETAVEGLSHQIQTKRAVDDALRERTDRVVKQQVSRREFWLGVFVVVISILSVAVQAGIL